MDLSPSVSIGGNPSRKQGTTTFFLSIVAFLTYASVYAYRKPFTVATFDGLKFWGVSYQTLLIISQVVGYMLSKFYGIGFISELKKIDRWKTALLIIGIAWLALFFFAIAPPPYGMFFLFINGFVLGLMWGIIFSYVEGRRATDLIGSVLAISFIFSGGFTRSVGKWLMMEWSVNEYWMPFVTGLVFLLPLIVFIFLLEKIPAPDEQDVMQRTGREPMSKKERHRFMQMFGTGLIIVTLSYLILSVMRDIRDNYMSNFWKELGYANDYSIFTRTETRTSLLILLIIGLVVIIKKNIVAFRISHFIIAAGFLLSFISSYLFINNTIGGALWMQLTGLGLYLAYIPFNCIFFERMIAAFKIKGNAGFLIYFADAFGYLGSVLAMLMKEFVDMKLNWTQFYSNGVVIASLIGLAGVIVSFNYFNIKYKAK